MLEQEIIPLYYARNSRGYSENWVRTIKNSIAQIAPHYTMKRQLDDYFEKFYNNEAKRFKLLSAHDNKFAKELAAWKEHVADRWGGMLEDLIADDSSSSPAKLVARKMLYDKLYEMLRTLPAREQQIIILRFGLFDQPCLPLIEISRRFNLTRERVRQLEVKIISNLRSPAKLKYLDGIDGYDGI